MFNASILISNDFIYYHYRGGPSRYYANNGVRIEDIL